ncbi:hypothetical protein NUACC21_76300 [Scytonema sp. NUACC21]
MTQERPDIDQHNSEPERTTPASGGNPTPVDESKRKTGMGVESEAKQSAKAESGEGSGITTGAANQGTDSR